MLKEIDQNMAIETSPITPEARPTSNHLAIHQTNIFRPHQLGATCMSASPSRLLLAVRRGYLSQKDINVPLSQLDFYNIGSKSQPKFMHTIIEYEIITGLSWLDEKHLLSVSSAATINIYNIKSGTKVKSMTTDYGPIHCMRHSASENLLVTGSETGYVAVYKVDPKDLSITCVKKLVKVMEAINAIDFNLKPRMVPAKKVTATTVKKPSDVLKHAKRKRTDSSDESDEDDDDNDDDQNKPEGEFLEMSDLTIYGGSLDKVISWDFHRETIIDTLVVGNNVNSVLVLKSGNIGVGDQAGYLGIIDHKSFTCRQSERLLDSAVRTISTNPKNSALIVAGLDPRIAILRIDKSSETKDVYILREKLKDHDNGVNCSLFTSKKEFFTCSDDNTVIKFRSRKSDGIQQVKRFTIRPHYKDKLNFNTHETMATFGKSLQIFKFSQDPQGVPNVPSRMALADPQRICTVRASAYVHAATLDDKWICYATSGMIRILDRPNLSRVDTTDPKLPACHIMRLCQSGRFLVIGQQKKLIVVELKDEPQPEDAMEADEGQQSEGVTLRKQQKVIQHKSIYIDKLKGTIRDLLYYPDSNQLIVSCGTTAHALYIIKLPSAGEAFDAEKNGVEVLFKTGIQYPIMHIARNVHTANDSSLYVYTSKDQLIKCDISSATLKRDLAEKLFQQARIIGLSKDVGIEGMVMLAPNQCLIYDSIHIYKVNLDTNEIINSTMDYAKILTIDDSIFNKPREILVVSAAPWAC